MTKEILKLILRTLGMVIVLVFCIIGVISTVWFHVFTPVNPAITLNGIDDSFFSALNPGYGYAAVEIDGTEYRLPIGDGFSTAMYDFLWYMTEDAPEGELLVRFSDNNRVISIYSDAKATVSTDNWIPGYLSEVHYDLPDSVPEALMEYCREKMITCEEWNAIVETMQ